MLHGWTNEIAAHHGNNENIVLPSMIGLSATQISPLKEIFSHKNIKMMTIFTLEGHLLLCDNISKRASFYCFFPVYNENAKEVLVFIMIGQKFL